MPILIRELHIKVSVNAPEGGTATPTAPVAGGTPAGNSGSPEERERLVAQCVEQVLDILKSQQEA